MSAAIDDIKSRVQQRVETLKTHPAMGELLKLHSALNIIEESEGIAPTPLSALFGLDAKEAAAPAAVTIKPGEYYGKTGLEAAKDFLTRFGKAATLDEILDALRKGGNSEVREKLAVSMARSTFNFVKIDDDHFDLLERYPAVKSERLAGLKNAKRKGAKGSEEAAAAKAAETA